jgi:hypothetical protein
MIATDFGQLQGFRNQRAAQEADLYFRAINEAQQLAAMEEGARQNDMAALLSARRIQEDAANRDYARRLADREFSFNLLRDNRNQRQDDRRLDIEEKRFTDVQGRADQREQQTLFNTLYTGVLNGDIPDDATLNALGGSTLAPDKRAALSGLFAKRDAQRKAELLATARGLEQEFAAQPTALLGTHTAPFRDRYKATTGVAPETDPLFTPDTAKNIIANTRGFFTSDSDVDNQQAAVNIAMQEAALRRRKEFSDFATQRIQKEGLPFVPDVATQTLTPVEPDVATYFAQKRGARTAAPVVVDSPRVAVPAAAVSFLKQNPHLRAQFDAKYGPGASAQYLP